MFSMKINFFLFAVCLLLVQQSSANYDDNLNIIDKIYNEKDCIMQGGMCVLQKDCGEVTAVKGLCPEQRHMGVECCYGISQKETRCRRRGGECFPQNGCNPIIQDKLATDCEDNEVCCILV